VQKLSRIFITALLAAIIFVVNAFLPPPLNYMLIVVEAVLLALSGLFIKGGASYVGAVGGLLTALASPALGPFTFFFTFLFGVFIDCLLFLFRINGTREGVNQKRLIAAMAASTLLIAITTYSSFALFPQFIPFAKQFWGVGLFIQRSSMLDMLVLFMGAATGGVAGYAASYLWNKYLRYIGI
jgi:hypothetical protein